MLLLLALLAAVVARPEWFLNQTLAGAAARYLARDFTPTWSDLRFEVSSRGWLDKEVGLRAADLCLRATSGSFFGCWKSAEVQAELRFSLAGAELVRVGRFSAQGERLRVDLRRLPAAAAPAKPASGPGWAQRELPRLRVGELSLSLPEVEVLTSSGAVKGSLSLKTGPGQQRSLDLRAELRQGPQRFRAEAALKSDLWSDQGLTYLSTDAQAWLPKAGRAGLKARLSQSAPGDLRLSFTGSGRARLWSFSASGQARRFKGETSGTAALEVAQSSGTLRRLSLRPVALAWEGPIRQPRRLRLRSRFQAQLAAEKLPKSLAAASALSGSLTLDGQATPKKGQPDHFDAVLRAALDPVQAWYEATGGLQARVSGRLGRSPRTWEIRHDLELFVRAGHFSDVMTLLSGTAFAVPAPLNALAGTLSLELRSQGDLRRDSQQVQAVLRSDLAGKRQRLRGVLEARVVARRLLEQDRRFEAQADVTLNDVALELPPLSLMEMPALAPDSRIKAPGTKAEELVPAAAPPPALPFPLAARWHVRTSSPALVYSNLAETPVPVALDLSGALEPSVWSGSVTLQSFHIRFFRRDAVVDHLRLTQAQPGKPLGLDGLVIYRTPEAVVFAHLVGTTAQPRVELESRPPLSRQEILALMLFGKSPDELDIDQQASVANTQGAMSESAFGLASLYLFASTPIDYVGYDPGARSYTVKFRLPGGASLSMGSSAAGTQRATLRQRLAPHWAIQTQLERTQEAAQQNVVTTLLEWFNRY